MRYGISETINCTLASLSDDLYHMLEFYVHHDVPLSCRLPSLPPAEKQKQIDGSSKRNLNDKEGGANPAEMGMDTDLLKQSSEHPPYTPMTIALQGTLQLSHLHIWTDMIVLAHYGQYPIRTLSTDREKPSSELKKGEKKRKSNKKGTENNQDPGQIIAATAYSLPFVITNPNSLQQPQTYDLWAPGQGTKAIRGEPLPLTFRVHWTEDDDVLETVSASHAPGIAAKMRPAGTPQRHEVLSTMIYLIVAAFFGAVVAIWWERNVGSGKVRWKGEGLLGYPSKSSPNMGFFHSDGKVSIGTRGAMNGYGGYGGYSSGKRD
ncbi:hypothetical protein KEM54_000053 [Ascosphaera aggregata]|nr:hypothetical protein KEM54_000053 [Ascosphaera aggregata]